MNLRRREFIKTSDIAVAGSLVITPLTELGNDIRENDAISIPSLMFKDAELSGI